MKSIESCQSVSPAVNTVRCDCCSAPIKAIIQLGCGSDNPRACLKHLPKLFAMVDLEAKPDVWPSFLPAWLSIRVVA